MVRARGTVRIGWNDRAVVFARKKIGCWGGGLADRRLQAILWPFLAPGHTVRYPPSESAGQRSMDLPRFLQLGGSCDGARRELLEVHVRAHVCDAGRAGDGLSTGLRRRPDGSAEQCQKDHAAEDEYTSSIHDVPPVLS